MLATPAVKSPLAPRALVNGLARADARIVAVGQRGHVLLSDDQGKTWRQAEVPVSSDLVAVAFPTATQGWAVGHDGVVLRSADAGATWTRVLDGNQLGAAMVEHYKREAAGSADAAKAGALVKDAERFADARRREPVSRRRLRERDQRLPGRRLRPDVPHRRRRRHLAALAAAGSEPAGAAPLRRASPSPARSTPPASRG